MSNASAPSLRAGTFGKRPAIVIDTAPKSGLPDLLERIGLGSALRISLLAMAAIFIANWWMG
jgi:hypothetical protein